nr:MULTISPECIES: DUF1109 domain-containing protein [unclassified Nocardiopsis]
MPQFGGPPPQPPKRPRLGLLSSPSAVRAALLNLSGTGAGYFYLRQWPFFAVAAVLTLGLLVAAAIVGATDNVLLWALVFAAWFAAAAVHGLFAGRSRDERALGRGEQPAKGRMPFVVAAVLVVALVVSVTGVWQAGEWRLRTADAAHARGECAPGEAVAAYEGVENLFQLSFSPSLMERARAGAEACVLLDRAQADVDSGDYERALESYASYFNHPASRWEDTDGEIADIHLSYAADLVSTAREGYRGEVTEDYRESMRQAHEVYSVIPVDYEGTEAAGQVPTALAEMYETGTGEYADERWCAGFDQIDVFADLDWSAVPEVAERIATERPDAALRCGWEHVDAGRFSPAEDMVDLLESEYPDHEAADVEKMTVHIGAGKIEEEMDTLTILGESDFNSTPTSSSGSGKAVLEVTNNTPFEMRFLYVGPDKVHDEIITAACENCEVYTSPPTGNSCFDDGDVMRVEFDPGKYRVLLTSSESLFDKPLHGNITFEAGDKHQVCYYKMEQ